MDWKPIETAPKEGETFLGYHVIHKVPIAIYYITEEESFSDFEGYREKTLMVEWPLKAFSHWVKMIELPENKG